MNYIVDTHSLAWYFTKDKRLSNRVKNILREAEKGVNEIIIPTIVLLEIIDIQEKKRVRFKLDKLFDFLEKRENFKIVDLNFSLTRFTEEVSLQKI